MTDEAKILHFPDWPSRVMRSIERDKLAQATWETMKLCNYTLKVQADAQWIAETRNCVLALWARCEREGATHGR